MHPLRTLLITGVAATLALGLSACGEDEPTGETSSAASTTDSTDEETAVAEVFDQYWDQANISNPGKPPSKELKALFTKEAYDRQVKASKQFPKLKVQGKDELVASKATTVSDTEATVEVCYRVRRQLIVTEAYTGSGGKVEAGTDIRSDHNGRPMKAGTQMVNLVTLERNASASDWLVDSTQVGYKRTCDLESKAS